MPCSSVNRGNLGSAVTTLLARSANGVTALTNFVVGSIASAMADVVAGLPTVSGPGWAAGAGWVGAGRVGAGPVGAGLAGGRAGVVVPLPRGQAQGCPLERVNGTRLDARLRVAGGLGEMPAEAVEGVVQAGVRARRVQRVERGLGPPASDQVPNLVALVAEASQATTSSGS